VTKQRPQLLCKMRRERRKHQHKRLDQAAGPLFKFRHFVGEHHHL